MAICKICGIDHPSGQPCAFGQPVRPRLIRQNAMPSRAPIPPLIRQNAMPPRAPIPPLIRQNAVPSRAPIPPHMPFGGLKPAAPKVGSVIMFPSPPPLQESKSSRVPPSPLRLSQQESKSLIPLPPPPLPVGTFNQALRFPQKNVKPLPPQNKVPPNQQWSCRHCGKVYWPGMILPGPNCTEPECTEEGLKFAFVVDDIRVVQGLPEGHEGMRNIFLCGHGWWQESIRIVIPEKTWVVFYAANDNGYHTSWDDIVFEKKAFTEGTIPSENRASFTPVVVTGECDEHWLAVPAGIVCKKTLPEMVPIQLTGGRSDVSPLLPGLPRFGKQLTQNKEFLYVQTGLAATNVKAPQASVPIPQPIVPSPSKKVGQWKPLNANDPEGEAKIMENLYFPFPGIHFTTLSKILHALETYKTEERIVHWCACRDRYDEASIKHSKAGRFGFKPVPM